MNIFRKAFFKLVELNRRISTRLALKVLLTDREQFLRFVENTWKSNTELMLKAVRPLDEIQRIYGSWLMYLRDTLSQSAFNQLLQTLWRVQIYTAVKQTEAQHDDSRKGYGLNLSADFSHIAKAFEDKAFSFAEPNPEVSLIYPYRDRDLDRLIASAASLKLASKVKMEVILVDFGSKSSDVENDRQFCESRGIRYVQVHAEGLPWSRGHALNIGAMHAKSEFIVTTDIDMLFETDILAKSIAQHKPEKVFHCRPLWLKQDGLKANSWMGDYNQLGGYQFISKTDFLKLNGFNPEIKFWGVEDLDFDRRQKAAGYDIVWLDTDEMYHMWHPHDYGDLHPRPISSWFDSERALMSAVNEHKIPIQDPLEKLSERPILEHIQENKPHEVITVNDYTKQIVGLLESSKKHKFIELKFEHRVNPGLNKFYPVFMALSEVTKDYSVDLQPVKDKGFDFFYLSLPILKDHKLIDYFISPEAERVYLLFK